MMVNTRRSSDALRSAAAAVAHKVAKSLDKQVGSRNHTARRASPVAAARVTKFVAPAKHRVNVADAEPLIDLGALEECELLRRPSSRNKSPYVADVRVLSTGITAIAHCPNLDSGGKCVPGTRLLCSRRIGIDADAVGPFGTPKCELVVRLLRCHEPEYVAPFPHCVFVTSCVGTTALTLLTECGCLPTLLSQRASRWRCSSAAASTRAWRLRQWTKAVLKRSVP